MFAVFSLIENRPTIHKIYLSEETTQKALSDFVIQYIQQGIKENKDLPLTVPLSVPLSDIKVDTFTSYPVRTYHPIDLSMIEIYEHSLSDKVEKGWVWNGTMKVVESKKVGYFQVLAVSDPIFEDQREYKTLSSEMDDLIQEIMDEISDTRISLEKDIEDVKKLQFDSQKHLELLEPILSPAESTMCVHDLVPIPYSKIEYPSQPSTKIYSEEFSKKDLKSFEERYLPFLDEYIEQEYDKCQDEQYGNQDDGDKNLEWSDDNNKKFQRCRRGSRRSPPGRANYGMRKMRLRSY
jgi:hypothetical protein